MSDRRSEPGYTAWMFGNLAVLSLWSIMLPKSAVSGSHALYMVIFALGFAGLVLTNRFRLTPWVCSTLFFSAFEPPTILLKSPVSIAGFDLIPYKFIPLVGFMIFVAYRVTAAGKSERARLWSWMAPRWLFVGLCLMVAGAFLSAIFSMSPVTAASKAVTLTLSLLYFLTIATLARRSDAAWVGQALSLTMVVLMVLTVLQAGSYFGFFPDHLLWFQYEKEEWLRFGVVGPQRAYASIHNPNYFSLWLLFALLMLRHLGMAKRRHYFMAIFLSILSLSASGVVTALFAIALARVPRVGRDLLLAVLLMGPLIGLPVIRSMPLPDTISSGSGRQYIAWAAANAVYSSPVVGIGLGVMDQHFEKFGTSNYRNTARVAHNIIWETMVSMGAVGVLGLYLLILCTHSLLRAHPSLSAAFLGFLVWAQWQPGLTWMPIWILWAALIGLAVNLGPTPLVSTRGRVRYRFRLLPSTSAPRPGIPT